MASELTDFSLRIIGAVKAELARRNLSGSDLIEPLSIGKNTLYARLKGERPFETEELAKIADFLGIDVETLIDSARFGIGVHAQAPEAVAS